MDGRSPLIEPGETTPGERRVPAESTPPVPPPLTESYQRARSRLGLVSALLFGWELIGIRLGEDQELGGVKIQLLTPDAIPWALVCLLCFFAVRLFLEWLQCDPRRRQNAAAAWDYGLANTLAVSAIALFAYQQIGQEQLFSQLARAPWLVLDALIGPVSRSQASRSAHRTERAAATPAELGSGLEIRCHRRDRGESTAYAR